MKTKHQHSLPNRQLARAFNFSAEDLSANRAGFMTRAQEWGIPLWLREFSILPIKARRRRSVETVCGRAKLEYRQFQISSLFHADIVEVYMLSIHGLEFRLKPQQYRIISEGLNYWIYYAPETKQILSLERAIHGCQE